MTTCGFVNFDDGPYVFDNAVVRQGITAEGVRWAFTTFHSENWHPVTWLSHMLDCQLFGVDPRGHHLVSLLFHVINACLLFRLLVRMTGAVWRSAAVAMLFAIHPLRVESVAWVAERKDVLSGTFWMLTLWVYVEYVRRRSAPLYLASIGLCALGLMAKSTLVTLPFVMLLLDAWPLRRIQGLKSLGPRIIEKLPFLALAALTSVMTYRAQHQGGAVASFGDIPWALRIANAVASYAAYIWKTFWPVNLCVLYPYRPAVPLPELIVALVLLVGVSVLVVLQRKRQPALVTGWCWYLGTLVPMLGLIHVGSQAMADRYTYVPSIGLGIVLVWGTAELLGRPRQNWTLVSIVAGVVGVALCGRTYVQIGTWVDSVALYERALAVTSHNPLVAESYGATLVRMGRFAEAKQQLDAALRDDPTSASAYFMRGLALEQLGDSRNATQDYVRAVNRDPELAEARLRLAVLLYRDGQVDNAIKEFVKALKSDPTSADGHNALGAALASRGRFREAVDEFRQAVRLRPDFEDARRNLERAERNLSQAPGADSAR